MHIQQPSAANETSAMPAMPTMNSSVGEKQQAQLSHSTKYLFQASKLLPSVTDRNPYIKEQVGNLIYDFVQTIIGPDKAPKITGMLIELPVQQIKQFLSSFEALTLKVNEANALLMETKKTTK